MIHTTVILERLPDARNRNRHLASALLAAVVLTACGQTVPRDVDPDPDQPTSINTAQGNAGATDPGGNAAPHTNNGPNTTKKMSAEELLEMLGGGAEPESSPERDAALEELLKSTDELGKDPDGLGALLGDAPPSTSESAKPRTVKSNEPVVSRDVHVPGDLYDRLVASATLESTLPADDSSKGLKRITTDHWRGSIFGTAATTASANYKHRKAGRVQLHIADLGRECAELTRRALLWQQAATRERASDGLEFERARMFGNHPGFVRYNGLASTASAEVVVRGRFHVYLVGTMTHLSTLETLFASIDFDSLER